MVEFTQLCIRKSNPFLPYIYAASIWYIKEESRYLLVVISERLHELDTLDESIIKQMFVQIGINLKEIQQSPEWHNNLYLLFQTDRGRQYIRKNTNNVSFIKALNLVGQLISKYGSDLRLRNFMVRLSSVGPQLVLNDPLIPAQLSHVHHRQTFQGIIAKEFRQLEHRYKQLYIDGQSVAEVVSSLKLEIEEYTPYLYSSHLSKALKEMPHSLIARIQRLIEVTDSFVKQVQKKLDYVLHHSKYNDDGEEYLDNFTCVKLANLVRNLKATKFFENKKGP